MTLTKVEFLESQQKIKSLPGEPVYARLFLRKLSFYITPVIARLPITPNMITVISILIGITGATFLMLPGVRNYFIGAFFIFSWYFLDVIDGDLARFKQKQSLKGVYIDLLGHYIVNPLIFSSFSIYLGLMTKNVHFFGLGFISFVAHQYSRLASDIYYTVMYEQVNTNSNPRQTLNISPIIRTSNGEFPKLFNNLRKPGAYLFDALSVTTIFGILRGLLVSYYTISIYITLTFCVFIGTCLIIYQDLEKF